MAKKKKKKITLPSKDLIQIGQRNQKLYRDFPAGTVVKNLPGNAGDTGLRLGPGRSHMPRSN